MTDEHLSTEKLDQVLETLSRRNRHNIALKFALALAGSNNGDTIANNIDDAYIYADVYLNRVKEEDAE